MYSNALTHEHQLCRFRSILVCHTLINICDYHHLLLPSILASILASIALISPTMTSSMTFSGFYTVSLTYPFISFFRSFSLQPS
ncbi:hypothetical protein BDZ91DRAFT_710475 [Kalaharituber pfeilii]|nr:hypothetical protein BDZ91DRAFT_710475 [Kalaharituber pfeilii]